MKQRSTPFRASRGFTLVETIMVLIVLGIAGVAITSLQGKLFANKASIDDMQVRTELMTEGMEKILAVRRFTTDDSYAAVASTTCDTLPVFGSYARPTVTVTDPYTGAACPTGGSCKTVTISQAGMTPLIVMLQDY